LGLVWPSAFPPSIFREFETGQRHELRTVTEDIVSFAGLSGDFNSIHTDDVYSKGSTFGRRVAHGILGLSIASGLAVRTGILEGTVMAFREIRDWKFSLPIYIGDTIMPTASKRSNPYRARAGRSGRVRCRISPSGRSWR
jgi:acyl dehydratase